MGSNFFRKYKNKKKLAAATAALVLVLGIGAAAAINKPQASSPVNVWWPTQKAHVTGVQPFKALLANADANSYAMYWQVDGGQLNIMNTDNTDYPHKQADVDVSSWNWHGSGPYTINFIAKDPSGSILGEQTSDIYIGAAEANTDPVQAATSIIQTVQSANANSPVSANNSSMAATGSSVNILWPFDGANLSGVQTLKAEVPGLSVDSYNMYWQVDGGRLNSMFSSNSSTPHKEADIDITGWSWHGSGPYLLNFVAKDNGGNVLSSKSVKIYIGAGSVATGAQASTSAATTAINTPSNLVATALTNGGLAANVQSIAPPAAQNSSSSSGALSGAKLWVNPNSDPANWAKQSGISSTDRQLMQKVAAGAETQWFSTNWISNMQQAVASYVSTAAASGAVPTMVLYNIPFRDCGQYSAGGANDPNSYKQTVDQFAAGIGSNKAAVIIEPDALTLTDCLSPSQLSQRFDLLKYAVQKFASLGNTATYLDIGHPAWKTPQEAAHLLASGGVQGATGFALNVANFYTDDQNISYGTQIANELSKLGISGKHFVIDSGRNGNGSNGQWCNPSGRALGRLPTTNTGNSLVDAFLWVKGPGGSDGNCNGGPAAGQFWPQYALDLARNAHW